MTRDEIKLMDDQLLGMTQRLGQLDATRKIMLQASALEAQVGKAMAELETFKAELEPLKAEQVKLQGDRNKLVTDAMTGFATRMEEALPEGQLSITLREDGKLDIGWFIGGSTRPYRALSGGEKVAFDIALAHAMGAKIIVKEASELDKDRLTGAMVRLQTLPEQVILVTCHEPHTVPEGWTVCRP